MSYQRVLYATALYLASLIVLSAAPPEEITSGKSGQLVEETETRQEKPSWVDRVFGGDRNDQAAESRREEAEARAEEARERKEAAEAKENKPNWVERLFGAGSENSDVDDPETEARGKAKVAKEAKEAERGFSNEERKVLEDWQRGEAGWKKSGKRLPPGLQKKVARGGELPPGWKKKLAIGEKLPQEYESEAVSLPEEILKRLPKTSEGTDILTIGDEVIRVMENTREIVDILGVGRSGTDG